jgi:hypothetical protein
MAICHDSQYWKISVKAVLAYICYGHIYGLYLCVFKMQQRCSLTKDTFKTNMPLLKNYGPNKFLNKIMAVSFVFWPQFDQIFCQFMVGPNKVGFKIVFQVQSL